MVQPAGSGGSSKTPRELIVLGQLVERIIEQLRGKSHEAEIRLLRFVRDSLKDLSKNESCPDLNAEIRSIKGTIIDVVAGLKPEDLHSIGEPLFDQVLRVAEISRRFFGVGSIEGEEEKTKLLKSVCRDFIDEKEFGRTLRAAELIPNEETRSFALVDLVTALTNDKKPAEALIAAKAIPVERKRFGAFQTVAVAFAAKGNSDKAIEIAEMITDQQLKSWALEDIPKTLRIAGFIDMAIEVAKKLPDEFMRSRALLDILQVFKTPENCDKYMDLLEAIPDEELRDKAIADIVNFSRSYRVGPKKALLDKILRDRGYKS